MPGQVDDANATGHVTRHVGRRRNDLSLKSAGKKRQRASDFGTGNDGWHSDFIRGDVAFYCNLLIIEPHRH